MPEPIPEDWIDAALAADAAWMRSARAVVYISPARDQVRAMLEAVAPLAAAALDRAAAITLAVFACREADTPMPFALYREEDVSGVSGPGTVAHGCEFADGTVVLRWLGKDASTVVWGSLDAAMRVHGHDGRTRVVWLAAPFSEMGLAEREAAAAERERICELADDVGARYLDGGDWSASAKLSDLIRRLADA